MTTFEAFQNATPAADPAQDAVRFEVLRPFLKPIQARIQAVDRRIRLRRIGLCLAVSIIGVTVAALAVTGLDLVWGLSAGVRGTLFYTAVVGLLAAVAAVGLRSVARPGAAVERAARIDAAYPELGSTCVAAVQFAEDLRCNRLRGWSGLAAATILDTAGRMADVAPGRIVDQRLTWRWLGSSLALLLTLAAALMLSGPDGAFQRSFLRVVLPFRFAARVGAVQIEKLTPGDKQILRGNDVGIAATIVDAGEDIPAATLFFQSQLPSAADAEPVWGPVESVAMERDDRTTFAFLLRGIERPTRYRVEIGGTEAPADRRWFELSLLQTPEPRRLALAVIPPAYTLKRPKLYTGVPPETIAVPAGSEVLFAVQPSLALKEGYLLIDEDQRKPLVKSGSVALPEGLVEKKLEPPPGDGPAEVWSASVTVPRSMRIVANLVDQQDQVSNHRLSYRLDTIPDQPPTVKFLQPGKDTVAAAGTKLHLVIAAADDYGLKELRIEYKRNKHGLMNVLVAKPYSPQPSENGGPPQAVRRVELPFDWELATDNFEQGDELFLEAVATDEFQTVRTPVLKITVMSSQALEKAKLDILDEIMRTLQRLLTQQQEAYGKTKKIPAETDAKRKHALAREVRVAQVQLLADTRALADKIQTDDNRIVWIRADLYKLVAGPETAAGGFAERLEVNLESGQADGLRIAAAMQPQLIAAQIQIMANLKALLQVLPRTREQVEQDIEQKQGSDLSNEVQATLQKTADELDDKLEQHKKAVEITQELAQKNVEDFTDKDMEKAKQVEAIEDDFSKFLQEKINELSKLTPQDFSDPRLIKELLQTYEEVEMAKDAMATKSVEVAVPLEQAGLENAEEIQTNLEKWLPDTPDRIAWKMEEPIGQDQVPMAELPDELEDIIGDLMENEEDLMESADDVTSAHADSLDKGAGWDALDGPISNFSAKGVTGNMLPNTSEINGRSGEGRQGKSSGEMVGSEAEGKGGRRTPTRLTPDQFQKGQIEDTSKDPAGGSTGGGKEGGAGGEGLEGPIPPETQNQMKRLAGAQADLRTKAEKINLQLRKSGYISPDLDKTIQEMKALENDMKDGRYDNIARRQNVILNNLSKIKEFVAGEVRVGNEGATVAPRKLVDNVLDAMDGSGVPPGYEEVLEGYYNRVLTGGGEQK